MIKQIVVQQATFAAARRSFRKMAVIIANIFQNWKISLFFFLIPILGDNPSSVSVVYEVIYGAGAPYSGSTYIHVRRLGLYWEESSTIWGWSVCSDAYLAWVYCASPYLSPAFHLLISFLPSSCFWILEIYSQYRIYAHWNMVNKHVRASTGHIMVCCAFTLRAYRYRANRFDVEIRTRKSAKWPKVIRFRWNKSGTPASATVRCNSSASLSASSIALAWHWR